MKTSLELSEHIFSKVRRLAQKRGTSVRALVEEGLRLILESDERKRVIKPKILTFGGDGMTDQFVTRGLSWDTLREEVYQDHGA